jgi:L-serine dehydratase
MRFVAFDATVTEMANRCYDPVGSSFVVSDVVAADAMRQKVIAPDPTVMPHGRHAARRLPPAAPRRAAGRSA